MKAGITMNMITTTEALPAALCMSSREIAELTGKRHDNVRADIERMAEDLSLTFQEKSEPVERGRPLKVFLLPKRETLILISGYSTELRARIIDRWTELEARSQPSLLIPTTLPDALRLAADLAEQKAHAEAQLADALPKALALDRITASDEALTFTQAAKALGIKRLALTNWLHVSGWIYRQNGSWVAYDQHIRNGRLQFKEARYTDDDTGQERHRPYCHILPKGLAIVAQHFVKES